MSKTELTTGEPVPEDRSHTELRPDGQQKGYVVLSQEERVKGFVKPVRRSYIHDACGSLTTMGRSLAETYARDPNFYSGTFCCACARHFDLQQFHWEDGEPMEPELQEAYHMAKEAIAKSRERAAAEKLERTERAEYERLKAKFERSGPSWDGGDND